ncbi:ABC transporter permease [Draconibacterium sediminis]|uniref:ABC transporter permease n=1 Tax=Draconibacterium sediminis TaxID=1544798 RepID=UPI0026EDA3F5|nr:ABC transporter permease [Draconibacterium sediminis]
MKTKRIILSALKSLGKNKLRSFLMMIGIIIGIIALTIIVSIGFGAKELVMERVNKFGTESLMIRAGGGIQLSQMNAAQGSTTLRLEDVEYLENEIPEIKGVAPFSNKGNADVKYFEKSTTATVFGVTPLWAPVWNWDVTKGEFITDEDIKTLNRICLIGPTVQKELFGDSYPIGEQIRIGNIQFEVKGILESKGTSPGGGDMDNRIMIPLSTFMRRVANIDYLSAAKVLLHNPKEINVTVEKISQVLRERHSLAEGEPDDFTIITPTEVTEMAEKVSGTFNIFLALLAGLSLITGGFVIANIMTISVNERKKEIGLRKAVGASSKKIVMQFLIEALAVTISGAIIGIVLGGAGAIILGIVMQMPVSVSWASILTGVISASIIGIIAGIQPARKAARLNPIEALK